MQKINYNDDNLNNIINSLLNNNIMEQQQQSQRKSKLYNNIDDNLCLITKEKLTEPVKLECNHTFNYKPLLNEIINQKSKKNYTETTKLKYNQIKCPYCRNVQNKLLPYFNNYPKYNGINYPISLTYTNNYCKYIFKSGKNKNNKCNLKCYGSYCKTHNKIMEKRKLNKSKSKSKLKIQTFNDKFKFNPNIYLKFIPSIDNKNDKYIIYVKNKPNILLNIPKLIPIRKDNIHKKKFYTTCNHVIKKGPNKNKICGRRILCQIDNNVIFYEKSLCNKHSNDNKQILKPLFIPKQFKSYNNDKDYVYKQYDDDIYSGFYLKKII